MGGENRKELGKIIIMLEDKGGKVKMVDKGIQRYRIQRGKGELANELGSVGKKVLNW